MAEAARTMRRFVAPIVCAALLVATATGCSRARPRAVPIAEGVEIAGCAALRAGPVCEVGEERSLVFAVPAPHAVTSARVDDANVEARWIDGRLVVDVP